MPKEMTASEASRNFSAVLDRAAHGETIAVTRNGRRIAFISPAPRANGKALREVFRNWRGKDAFDDAFAENVATARETAAADLDSDSWRD